MSMHEYLFLSWDVTYLDQFLKFTDSLEITYTYVTTYTTGVEENY